MNDREVIGCHSKSFALAARLLPSALREQAEALYVWCRAADDRIDHAQGTNAAGLALDELREEVAAVYAGTPINSGAAAALRRVVTTCNLPQQYPLELLDGFEMDVRATRYKTVDELLLYCHRVAGVVGLMMCHTLGVVDDAALLHADHLGVAMQLTNIARDVEEDWKRRRLYLPDEWLPVPLSMTDKLVDTQVVDAVKKCVQLAARYYQSGEQGLQYLSPRCALAIRTASQVYQAIGDKVAAQGYRPSVGRAFVSQGHKIGILIRTILASTPRLISRMAPVHAPKSLATFRPLPALST